MPPAKFSRGKGGKSAGIMGVDLPITRRQGSHFSRSESAESTESKDVFDDHRLISWDRGESEVEELAFRIEDRIYERIPITADVNTRFVKMCRAKAEEMGYPLSRIQLSDVMDLRDAVQEEVNGPNHVWDNLWKLLGFKSHSEQLLLCFNKSIELVKSHEGGDMGWFHYLDFNIYYTRAESRWPWIRSPAIGSFMAIFCFYLFSPIFFCLIVQDEGVCPTDPTGANRSYYGWVTTLHFASTTLSTVGYGDVTVSKDSSFHIFSGILYMILSNVMLIVAFSAAADSSTTVFTHLNNVILKWVWGDNENELTYKKIRRVTFLRIGQIVCTFFFLNLIGIFASRIFVLYSDDGDEEPWSWMTSFYWAVQTTTTIGYGDLNMGFSLRWFQIFYLILSTYFVGNTLGGLASLKDEIHEIQSHTAWNRRELSKGLIDELQPYDHDDKIDQYEFLVASLVTLGKVSYSDVVPIMDKFRSLACKEGFIMVDEADNTDGGITDPEIGVDRDLEFRSMDNESPLVRTIGTGEMPQMDIYK